MRKILWVLMLAGLNAGLLAEVSSSMVKVYAVGAEVAAPELLPAAPIALSTEKCKNKFEGKAVLSLIVDAAGIPQNVMFIRPVGTDLDRLAVLVVGADRFKPGMYQGTKVAVGRTVEVAIKGCFTKDSAGKSGWLVRLRAQPVQKFDDLAEAPAEIRIESIGSIDSSSDEPKLQRVGNGVSQPTILLQNEASYSDEAREKRINGTCVVSLVVDAHGLPQRVHIVRALGSGLDEKALASVERYRFKPAMYEGTPVPVPISVEVRFRLY